MQISNWDVRDNLRRILAEGPNACSDMLRDMKEVVKWVKEE